MYNYNKTHISPYDPTILAIHSILRPEDDLISNCGRNFKETVSFDDIVHFIVEENIVTYVELNCGNTSYQELLQKLDTSTENGITFTDLEKKPSAFLATMHITVLMMSSIPLLSFWTRTIYGTWFQQLLCHSTTLTIETLCPTSTLNQQLTNLEQTHMPCSFRC